MGGGFALLYAVRAPLGAAGVFYGQVPSTAAELRGVCPVVAGYGGRDKLFAAHGRRLETHLQELGVSHDVRMYPEAGHSFMSQHTGVMEHPFIVKDYTSSLGQDFHTAANTQEARQTLLKS